MLKIICHRNGWPYEQKDSALTLVRTFITRANLEPYFESMLITTSVLRNKLSVSHGAAVENRQLSRHLALYALNVTASAMLFVTEEAGN